MLTVKFGKRLAQKDRAKGQRLKAELVAMEKNLRQTLFGKRAADIDEKLCHKLCNEAARWHEGSRQRVAASSVKRFS